MGIRYKPDPEEWGFGSIFVIILAVIWIIAWPWGLIAGPWVWWLAIGLSLFPTLMVVGLWILPLFTKSNWEKKRDNKL